MYDDHAATFGSAQGIRRPTLRSGRACILHIALLAGTALSGVGITSHALAQENAAGAILPTGGIVRAGEATIGQPVAGSLLITQSSGKAIIDWSGFSVGQGGGVMFENGAGATLNRVTGPSLSSIDGLLGATGSIYLINPNGVLLGKSGVVRVGGTFVASTLDVADSSFLSGGPLTFAGPSTTSVVNLGKVGALGGDVALIATTVSNAGSVSAPNGSAGLLSGSRVSLTDASLDGGRFAVSLPAAGGSVTNSGAIEAAAAELRSNGGDIYALAGDTSGMVRATGVTAGGGRIWLVAENGTAHVTGTLDAQGAGGTAGQIETSGQVVQVGAAAIDAHGGTWTLDPVNLTIDSTAANTISNALATSDVVEQTTAAAASGIGNQANGAGDIILASGAVISWSSAKALTLSAYHDVNLLGTINDNGAGVLTLRADNAATGSGTVKLTGTNGQVTLGSGATANIFYNPTSYTDTATRSTQQGVAIPTFEVYTNPYSNPYNASNPGQTVAANAPVQGGTVRAYMLVNSLAQLGGASVGGLTGVGAQLNGVYALNVDIDATSTKTANPYSVSGTTGAYGFLPIGYTGTQNSTNNFIGLFDGQGHTISNLYINHIFVRTDGSTDNTDSAGLFGNVVGNDAGGAIVRNLGLINPTVIGVNYVGALAGYVASNALASNVYATGVNVKGGYKVGGLIGEIANAAVSSAYTTGAVTGGTSVGGLLGDSYPGGTVTNAYSTAALNPGAPTTGSRVGGLVGDATGTYTNVYATQAVSAGDTVGGLFGAFSGTLTNGYATGAVTGNGGLVGGLIGVTGRGSTLTGVYATGFVTGAAGDAGGLIGAAAEDLTLSNSYATGSVTAKGDNVGGLIGRLQPATQQAPARATIANSFATGNVTSSGGGNVGGLVGLTFANTITTSYASGAVKGVGSVGGLVGASTDYGDYAGGFIISDSYATGSVTGTGVMANASTTFIGGLIGSESHDEGTTGATTTLTRTYATGLVSGNAVAGGLVGRNAGVITNDIWDRTSTGQATGVGATQTNFSTSNPATISVTNLTSVQDTDASAADYAFSTTPYTNAGFGFGITPGGTATRPWVQINTDGTFNGGSGAMVNTRPFLLMEYSPTINNAHQLQLMSLNLSATYMLSGALDASSTGTTGAKGGMWGASGFVPIGTFYIGEFSGAFMGGGNTISGLTINNTAASEVGLFGRTTGVISGVTLSGGSVTGTGSVGALAGNNSVSGSAPSLKIGTISNSTSNLAVVGQGNGNSSYAIGGLVGRNSGVLSGVSASGAVTNTDTAQNLGGGTGGLVGINLDLTGQKTALIAAGATASGAVTSLADADAGGLVGYDSSIAGLSGVSASGAVKGYSQVGGLVGVTSAPIVNSSATGAVSGTLIVGGLVGASDNDISGSSAIGAVTGTGLSRGLGGLVGVFGDIFVGTAMTFDTDGSTKGQTLGPGVLTAGTAKGDVSGESLVGGLVGFASGQATISGSSASGRVQAISDANNPSSGSSAGGLVGRLGGATITSSTAAGVVSGQDSVGGLAGSVVNFTVSTGQILTNAVSGSAATGTVTATGSFVGGLVGLNRGAVIADSYETGEVSGMNFVGGIAGANLNDTTTKQGTTYTAKITGTQGGGSPTTFALGAVTGTGRAAGGIAGENQGAITSVVYTPNNGAGLTGAAAVGGLVGLNDAGATVSGSATGAVKGTSYTGGLIGDNFGSLLSGGFGAYAVTTSSNPQSVTGGGGVGGLVGVNEGGATIAAARVGGGARSGAAVPVTVTGTGNDVGGIAGANFGTLTGVGAIATTVSGVDHTGGLVGYNAGAVTGAMDGTVNGRDYTGGQIGLNFGSLTMAPIDFQVSFLTNPTGATRVNARTYVGGLIGFNDTSGTITGGVSPATVAATGSYVGGAVGLNKGTLITLRAVGGSVSGANLVGGLVGLNQGSVSSSASTDAVTGDQDVGGLVGFNDTGATIAKSYATGVVTGRVGGEDATTRDDYVGGLIGVNFGAASDVYATGAVSGVQVVGGLVGTNMPGGSITRAYSTGAVSATRGAVGGLAGVQAGTLTSVYFQPAASAQAGGVGYTTANASGAPTAIGPGTTYDATAQATYQGYDFSNTWQANTGASPTLKGVSQ